MKNSGIRALILAAALVLLAGVPVFAEVADYGARGALENSSPTLVERLKVASENHLNAFQNNLKRYN